MWSLSHPNLRDNCVIISDNIENQGTSFSITDTKLDVPVVTLSIEGNAKILQQLKSSFKRIINWNEYLSKVKVKVINQ